MGQCTTTNINRSGLHNLCHPTIRDGSTWTKFGARGEHGDTLIYGISSDGSKNFNICTCGHMILGQPMMGARQTKNAPLLQMLVIIIQ